jgi:hypothetical protein
VTERASSRLARSSGAPPPPPPPQSVTPPPGLSGPPTLPSPHTLPHLAPHALPVAVAPALLAMAGTPWRVEASEEVEEVEGQEHAAGSSSAQAQAHAHAKARGKSLGELDAAASPGEVELCVWGASPRTLVQVGGLRVERRLRLLQL